MYNRSAWWKQSFGIDITRIPGVQQRILDLEIKPRVVQRTRTLFATHKFRQGDVIARLPLSSALHGSNAAALLSHNSPELLKDVSAFVKQYVSSSKEVLPLTTRDPVLMLVAMAVVKLRVVQETGLAKWMQQLPLSIPPIGVLLDECAAAKDTALDSLYTYDHRKFGRERTAERRQTYLEGIIKLEENLQAGLVLPLATVLRRHVPHSAESALVTLLHWAYFMLRSRTVMLHRNFSTQRSDSGNSFPALVPFVDMINHSAIHCNVSFTMASLHRSSLQVEEICVSALRNIEVGAQLFLDYGNIQQRGPLFPCRCSSQCEDRSSQNNYELARRQLAKYRQETISPISPGEENTKEAEAKAAIQADEASWIWMFGFNKSQQEKEYEHSLLWHAALKERIDHMTDVRRRGQPGEFVIGVPEGLAEMKKTRGRLRGKYGPCVAFPEPPSDMEQLSPSLASHPDYRGTLKSLPY